MSVSRRTKAILQALLVTLLWSSSWILVKQNIQSIPPLTFAGLRYTLAFLILVPSAIRKRDEIRSLKKSDYGTLILLGLVYYAMTQGGQFLTLKHLDAIGFSLILNFSALIVALYAVIRGKESPLPTQWLGMTIFLVGALLFFLPQTQNQGSLLGYGLAIFTMIANAASSVMGRDVNRNSRISPIVITSISMGVGGIVMLVLGLVLQGLPAIGLKGWLTILWLAAVNTAFAFWLWNKSLQVLTAVESSVINNTMLVQVAILAWIFLGEKVTSLGIVGLVLAALGILFVNLKPRLKQDQSA
ncbi:MAG TPA: DMT family transporter [Anaerolineaceae bacterium]|nr:DMT family transporter [Anaerolineaceae bacterium]